MAIKSLAVFCGSKNGTNPVFIRHAEQLGKLLAEKNVTLIYGGANIGIMGAIADSTMNNGGRVVGIIPKVLVDWERKHEEITELIITEDMHDRKKIIYERSDAVLVLPGGFGTLDELFETITWNQLSIHEKHVFILNSAGFYTHLIRHIEQMKQEHFLYGDAFKIITILNDPDDLIKFIS
jgi:uncharacterized protein (TIGR00730 family)